MKLKRCFFFSHQNPCFSSLCLHDSICLNGYKDKQYLCRCQAGYTGEQCEKGEAESPLIVILLRLLIQANFLNNVTVSW